MAKKEEGKRHWARSDLKLRARIEEYTDYSPNPQFFKFVDKIRKIEDAFTLPPSLSKAVFDSDDSIEEISKRMDFYLSVKVKGVTIAEIIKSAPVHKAGYQIEESSISDIFHEYLRRIEAIPRQTEGKVYLVE